LLKAGRTYSKEKTIVKREKLLKGGKTQKKKEKTAVKR